MCDLPRITAADHSGSSRGSCFNCCCLFPSAMSLCRTLTPRRCANISHLAIGFNDALSRPRVPTMLCPRALRLAVVVCLCLGFFHSEERSKSGRQVDREEAKCDNTQQAQREAALIFYVEGKDAIGSQPPTSEAMPTIPAPSKGKVQTGECMYR